MNSYRCPCCGVPGERSKFRNLRIECYKLERRRACERYREAKRERERPAVPEMVMNETAVAMLSDRIVSEVFPCPRRGR